MPLDYSIAERTLANGLRVVVSEDHSVPNVTVNLWVNVGSRHEADGRTGFAHLFELALWMEADRHGFLLDAVNQANLDNQRDVVKEEKRQRYDNVPYGNALIDIYAAVFPKGHPYHHATIGSMDDLDAASLEDVHAFFRRYYGPNNTVLTLCGDITAEEGFAAAERYFGDLPASAEPPRGPVDALEPLSEPVRDE